MGSHRERFERKVQARELGFPSLVMQDTGKHRH